MQHAAQAVGGAAAAPAGLRRAATRRRALSRLHAVDRFRAAHRHARRTGIRPRARHRHRRPRDGRLPHASPGATRPAQRTPRKLTPHDTLRLHRQQRQWLQDKLAEPFAGPTVVVTHHGPHRQSLAPRFAADWVSTAYLSELPASLLRRAGAVDPRPHAQQPRLPRRQLPRGVQPARLPDRGHAAAGERGLRLRRWWWTSARRPRNRSIDVGDLQGRAPCPAARHLSQQRRGSAQPWPSIGRPGFGVMTRRSRMSFDASFAWRQGLLAVAALCAAALAAAQPQGGLYIAGAGFSFQGGGRARDAQNRGGQRFFLLSLPPETAALGVSRPRRHSAACANACSLPTACCWCASATSITAESPPRRWLPAWCGARLAPAGGPALPPGERYFPDENPAQLPRPTRHCASCARPAPEPPSHRGHARAAARCDYGPAVAPGAPRSHATLVAPKPVRPGRAAAADVAGVALWVLRGFDGEQLQRVASRLDAHASTTASWPSTGRSRCSCGRSRR